MAGQIKKITVGGQTYEIGGGISAPINTTYASLKSLKDSNGLVIGQKYRITDFVSVFDETGITSANHPFDLVIEAISENLFSETANAIIHSGDDYFATQKLNAWEVRYCFDNDTTRFPQASSSGKGFIYYLKDEYGNEACYDFKNALFELTSADYDFISTTIHAFTFSTYISDMTEILDASFNNNKLNVKNNKVKSFKKTVLILKKPTLLTGNLTDNILKSDKGIVIYTSYGTSPSIKENNIEGTIYINSAKGASRFNVNSVSTSLKFKYTAVDVLSRVTIVSYKSVNTEITVNQGCKNCFLKLRDKSKIVFDNSLYGADIDITGGSETEYTINQESFSYKKVKINLDGTYKAIDPFA